MKRLLVFAVLFVVGIVGLQPALAEAHTADRRYVALGDSVAAGAGLPLKDGTPESRACGRSSQAYPFEVGAKLNVTAEMIACGGATVPQGITGPQTAGGLTFAPQIEQLYQSGRTPTHLSLTVGTNDIRWAEFIGKCYAATCGTWQDTVAAVQLQYAMFNNLRAALQQIRQQHPAGQPLPKVVVSGYFQPLSTAQPACADTQGLSPDEIKWILHQEQLLNNLIRSATALSGFARYASVDFSGHELCSATPWVQGLRDVAPYHPTAAGQAVIADAVVRAF